MIISPLPSPASFGRGLKQLPPVAAVTQKRVLFTESFLHNKYKRQSEGVSVCVRVSAGVCVCVWCREPLSAPAPRRRAELMRRPRALRTGGARPRRPPSPPSPPPRRRRQQVTVPAAAPPPPPQRQPGELPAQPYLMGFFCRSGGGERAVSCRRSLPSGNKIVRH